MRTTLLIACAQPDAARALRDSLAAAPGLCVDAETEDLAHLVGTLWRRRPDVLALEVEAGLPVDFAGLHAASASTGLLVMAEQLTEAALVAYIQRGVSGCLPRPCPPDLLARAAQAVHHGQPWFGRGVLLEALRKRIAPAPGTDDGVLTPREREIFRLAGDAMSNKEIARLLAISDKTVKTHLHRIYVKLHASGRQRAWLSRAGV